nr:NDR1/HIN1-like protein 12 [Ipomoea batatas]
MSIQISLTQPRFYLRHATLHNFTLTSGAGEFLTTNITVALAAQIPYSRRGIYYDRLDVYAVYQNRKITLPAPLPASYQAYKDVSVWSAFLSGNSVPVEPGAGKVMLNIVVEGWIRKHFWNLEVGPCRLSANCPVFLDFGSRSIESSPVESCHVEVKYEARSRLSNGHQRISAADCEFEGTVDLKDEQAAGGWIEIPSDTPCGLPMPSRSRHRQGELMTFLGNSEEEQAAGGSSRLQEGRLRYRVTLLVASQRLSGRENLVADTALVLRGSIWDIIDVFIGVCHSLWVLDRARDRNSSGSRSSVGLLVVNGVLDTEPELVVA